MVIFSLCSALYLSIKWPDISIIVVATAARLSLALLFSPRVTLSLQGPGAHLEPWSDPFSGARSCPRSLSCPALDRIPRTASILPVSPTGSPPKPQYSSVFCSLDPPGFLPSLSLFSAPQEGSAEPLPLCGQKAAPAGRLGSGGHLGRMIPDFSRVESESVRQHSS